MEDGAIPLRALRYSIILPTLNRPDFVLRFLDSVRRQTIQPAEIILVDQSDDTRTKDIFDAFHLPAGEKKYLRSKVKSLILARNKGIDACGATDFIAFFDDDLILRPNFCEEILKIFAQDTEKRYAGGMGTMQGFPHKRRVADRIYAFFHMSHRGNGAFTASGFPTYPHWKTTFCHTDFLSGGLTFWRREIIQEYKYDERLSGYGYGDDSDVSRRISKKYKNFFQPSAICIHEAHKAPGRDKAWMERKGMVQNFYYLGLKNGFSKPAYCWTVFGILLQDLILLHFHRVHGVLTGIRNVCTGNIDTVAGFADFRTGNASS